jgi:hypothetical protein
MIDGERVNSKKALGYDLFSAELLNPKKGYNVT